jgi:TRAP-type transport system small permease protein
MIKGRFNVIDDVISTIALVGVVGLTGINVILRYAFNFPVPWVEEVVLGLFIWLVFIGMSSTMKRDGHVGVDYFVNMMPRPVRILSEIVRAAAIYYVLIYVFIYLGSSLMLQATNKLTPILGLSYQMIDIAVPIGGLLTAIHFTKKLIRTFQTGFGKEGGL